MTVPTTIHVVYIYKFVEKTTRIVFFLSKRRRVGFINITHEHVLVNTVLLGKNVQTNYMGMLSKKK